MTGKLIRFIILFLFLSACKKEFSEVGNNIIKDPDYQFEVYKARNIKFYSHPVEHVKSVGQPLVGLGVYKHPAYGLTEANLRLTFLPSSSFDSEHFRNADSILFVQLRIPFFSEKDEEQSTDSDPVYKVDSVFGHLPFDLKAYYNNYYFFPYDPQSGFTRPPSYYSDFPFENYNGDLLYENSTFEPDLTYFVDTIPRATGLDDYEIPEDVKGTIRTDTVGPMFYINLDTAFFRQKIFNHAGEPVLTNSDLFQSHFRGLYLTADAIGNDGTFMLFDAGQAYLVLAYRYRFTNNNGTPDDTSDDYPDTAYEEIILWGNMKVNTYHNLFYPSVQQQITAADRVNGEEKVYVKGDAGSMGILELFDSRELYELRNNNWLINQANLRIYVDENEMAGIREEHRPSRMFMYKYDYQQPIADLDPVLDDGSQVDYSVILDAYNGRLTRDSVSGKSYYEFNITRQIKNVLRKDSSNVRLGIRMVQDLGAFLQGINQLVDPDAYLPFGTVLKGNRATEDPVELRIYYTKPEEE